MAYCFDMQTDQISGPLGFVSDRLHCSASTSKCRLAMCLKRVLKFSQHTFHGSSHRGCRRSGFFPKQVIWTTLIFYKNMTFKKWVVIFTFNLVASTKTKRKNLFPLSEHRRNYSRRNQLKSQTFCLCFWLLIWYRVIRELHLFTKCQGFEQNFLAVSRKVYTNFAQFIICDSSHNFQLIVTVVQENLLERIQVIFLKPGIKCIHCTIEKRVAKVAGGLISDVSTGQQTPQLKYATSGDSRADGYFSSLHRTSSLTQDVCE